MKKPCSGSEDKKPPKDITWKSFPHRLFFGRDFSQTWGNGGVAFVDPECNTEDKTYMCLYRITYVVLLRLPCLLCPIYSHNFALLTDSSSSTT